MALPIPLILLVGAGALLLRNKGSSGSGGYAGSLDTAVQRQSALAFLGLYKGKIDGIWGTNSKAGVTALEKANGWPQTDQWSPEVDSGVRTLLPSTWKPSPKGSMGTKAVAGSSGYPTLSIDGMKQVQRQLRDVGHYDGPTDGKYTTATSDAVKKFQAQKGLPVDGQLPPTTLSSLDSASPAAGLLPLKQVSEISTISETNDSRPNAQATDVFSGTESGLTWKIWAEQTGGPYAQWQHAVRNAAGELVTFGSRSSFTLGDAANKQEARENEISWVMDDIAELTTPPLPAVPEELLKLPPIQSWQVGFNANLSDYVVGPRWQDASLDNWLDSQRRQGWLATKYDEVPPNQFLANHPDYLKENLWAGIKITSRVLSVSKYSARAGIQVASLLARSGLVVAPVAAGVVAWGLVAYWGYGMVIDMMEERHQKLLEGSSATTFKKFIDSHHVVIHGADGPMLIAELPQTPAVIEFLEEIAFYIARFQSSSFS